MAEVKRKQKQRLESAAKRRSTATCSSRDRGMEGIALESVLQRFLHDPQSRRRVRTPSPISTNQTENLLQKKRPNSDSKKQSQSLNRSPSSFGKENIDDKKPEKKTGLLRKSGECASVASEDEDVPSEKEVQKLREVAQRVLHYQSSRGSVSSEDYISPVTSPHRCMFQEDREKLMSVTNEEDATKPLKNPVLLITKTSSGICRRHTISLPQADASKSDTDEEQFVPTELENESPGNKIVSLGNIGKIKSVDSYMPATDDGVGNKVPSSTPTDKSEKAVKAEVRQESLSSSQQNPPVNGQISHTRRDSRLISFFKRLGEKSKMNAKEPDSSSVDP